MERFEIKLASYQEDGFIVKAENVNEALVKVLAHAKKKHPGLLNEEGMPKEYGYPLVFEMGGVQWN